MHELIARDFEGRRGQVELTVEAGRFDIRRDHHQMRRQIAATFLAVLLPYVLFVLGKALLGGLVVEHPQANLAEIVRALAPPSRFARRLDRRQEQCHQHANDGDHHQQLNERECPASLAAPRVR